jgi:D-amino-acid oxidase
VPGSSPQALREAKQAQRTYEFFKLVAADEPAAGIMFLKGVEHLEAPPLEYMDSQSVRNVYSHLDGFRYLSSDEVPAGVKWGVEYGTYVVNSPVYCAHMLRKFILKGGSTKRYTLAHLNEAFSLATNVKTVVNCSGLGFDDPKSFIIRGMRRHPLLYNLKESTNMLTDPGQTCLVRNPVSATITRQNTDGSWSFCIPRPLDGGTVIGGTKQPHDWDPNPSPETRATLLANASKWFPFTPESGGQFDVIRDIVGRRPAREGGMRIEVEKLANGKQIVHAYGAGGRGFELSWGVAEGTAALMLENGLLREKAVL